MDLFERIFKETVLYILHVMIGILFSPLTQFEIIIYGLIRMCVKSLTFLLGIFILDLALNYIDKL